MPVMSSVYYIDALCMSVYAVNIAHRNYDIVSIDILSGILPHVAYLASRHCSRVKL